MAKSTDRNFIHLINKETGEEIYKIQFDYGVQKVDVTEGTKITLDFVHGGFEEYFTRAGNDLIIGDDMYLYMAEPLGVGHGKEEWFVSEGENSTYNITVSKYRWAGSQYGYADDPYTTETVTMTADELTEFQSNHNVTVNLGFNTLYTTWPVLPDPNIYYHMEDHGFYAPANGKIILKDYFLYGKDSVYVGDKLLADIIKASPQYASLINANSKKPYNLYDTFFDDNLYGGDRADKIHSYMADDMIDAGKGNDKIYLGEGNKTIVLAQGDGKDTVYGSEKTDSVSFKVDTDTVYFTKSGNNLILNRQYFDETTEQTVINNYFKNPDKTKISVMNGDVELVADFTDAWQKGEAYLRATGSKVIKGTDGNDEAYSSSKNETFILGKGNDIIHFQNDGYLSWSPYSFGKDTVKLVQGSHVTLDMSNVGGRLSFERKGNDAVITARHRMEICGRDNGKEEWVIKKSGKDTYTVTKTTYHFTGDGYKSYSDPTVVAMTKSELDEFQANNGVTLKVGKNTLYTSWAVVPNPVIHYSMYDSANWGSVLGTITLKDYFKYREDSVYIGDKSLQEYFKDEIFSIDKSKSKKGQNITDTYYNEIITGSKKSDRIISYYGADEITAGKGNDEIYLGEGNKTVNINKGDGCDTIKVLKSNTSTNIVFDEVDKLSFDKQKNDLVITRYYGNSSEKTVIKNYFVMNLENTITVSTPDFSQELNPDLVGLTMEITCKYPPIDVQEPKPELIFEYSPVEEPVAVWTCQYPPGDSVSVNEINQQVSAWQTDGADVVAEYAPTATADMPVLVMGN